MAFGSFESNQNSMPMAEINIIPLVDVMLVLLVIFIITAPLLMHAVKIDLPRASSETNLTKPEHISLSIDQTSQLYWNGEKIADQELHQRLNAAAQIKPQPELHLSADKTTQYQKLAEVMSEAAKVGLQRIGFVTNPRGE